MSDPRITPNNGRVADRELRGQVAAERFVDGTPAAIAVPVADLQRSPGGARDRQLLFGDAVTVYETRSGYSYLRADKDGYCGYIASAQLGPAQAPTHWVKAPATHVYEGPDIKSPDRLMLSLTSRLVALDETHEFIETALGYVPKVHLAPMGRVEADPATVALSLLGTPYLWGGNSRSGLDCSGLVQAALLACGHPCPGDSDLQQALGSSVPKGEACARGDLLFWKGHVAMALDARRMVHANGFHMMTVIEEIDAAITRIQAQGDGPVLAHRRL